MKKSLFIFIVVFTLFHNFIKADYLNTSDNNQCVYEVKPYQGHKGWCYTKRSNDQSYCSESLETKDLVDGYIYDGGDCILKNDLKLSNLTQNEWDYLMAVLAHIIGFTQLFLLLLLIIRI